MNTLKVYYDNWCPNCTRFMKFIKKNDLLNVVIFKELRDNNHSEGINLKEAEKKMASTVDDKSWNYGYKSIYEIFKRIPLFWLFVPVLFLLKITRLGEFLYNELALKRKIIPMHCDEHCEIN
ncbi:DCC1-like thiol-disulfide oxidoreductase family protein [Psychroserpens sp. AS72]|uniref:DCC1-like thiol-disulfide oxidoreductase family protein n=1 Tax=Psychroserpens sp. AS72 TaxID=3135775 RepID=UPI00317E3202